MTPVTLTALLKQGRQMPCRTCELVVPHFSHAQPFDCIRNLACCALRFDLIAGFLGQVDGGVGWRAGGR